MALLGIDAYLERFTGDSEAKRIREALAERLLHAVHRPRDGRAGRGPKIW